MPDYDKDYDKDDRMMTLLVRIDERSLNTLEQVKNINSIIASHEVSISALKVSDAERKGEARAVGRTNGVIWGVASSVILTLLSYFVGVRK